jgi:hypothetical protein
VNREGIKHGYFFVVQFFINKLAHQTVIVIFVLKFSASQNKATKILISDWLYQFLHKKFCLKIDTVNQKIEICFPSY